MNQERQAMKLRGILIRRSQSAGLVHFREAVIDRNAIGFRMVPVTYDDAIPIVPPSTNSALVSVWRRSTLPFPTWATQLKTRRTTGALSQRMWETGGSHHTNELSGSEQTIETSSGTRRPVRARK